jgi:ParB family transcriptional regulator, chromosome partitioning protein
MDDGFSNEVVEEIRRVPLHVLRVNPHQPRKVFDVEALEELARSIEMVGLIHPPVVRPIEEGCYELISGERRYRACELMGMKKISVVVRVTPTEQSAQAALIENVQRVDLNPIEIAQALHRLVQDFHYSQEKLAQKVGKKRSTIANYLRLLSLSPLIQRAVVEGGISMGHAKVILSLEGAEAQEKLYRRIVDAPLTVREAENLVIQKKPSRTGSQRREKEVHLAALEEQLQEFLGTQVKITGTPRRGQIRIEYYSLDDLNDLVEKWGIRGEG